MEDIVFQINVIAISLAFIAIAILILSLAIFFILLASYFRFTNKFDKILDNIESISYKVNNIASFVDSETERAKRTLNDMHDAFDNISNSIYNFTSAARGWTENLSIANIIKSIINLFRGRQESDDDF